MKFSRLFLIGLLALLTLVLVQLPGATWGWTGNPMIVTAPIVGGLTGSLASTKASENTSYTLTFEVVDDLANGVDEISSDDSSNRLGRRYE